MQNKETTGAATETYCYYMESVQLSLANTICSLLRILCEIQKLSSTRKNELLNYCAFFFEILYTGVRGIKLNLSSLVLSILFNM